MKVRHVTTLKKVLLEKKYDDKSQNIDANDQ